MNISDETRQNLLRDLSDADLQRELRERKQRTRTTRVESSSYGDCGRGIKLQRVQACPGHLHIQMDGGGSVLFYKEDVMLLVHQLQAHLDEMR